MVETSPSVVIVGGGFTGAAVATHLARKAAAPLSVRIVEPRTRLGGGVAYSSTDPAHRTNVAAANMSLFTDDDGHFQRWIRDSGAVRDDPEAVLPDGRAYVRRSVFGAYVAEQLRRAAADGPATIEHVRERATAIDRSGGRWRVTAASGRALAADVVVLATSHPPPATPARLAEAFAGHAGFVPDPWRDDALDGIGGDDRVLVMGTALSMADVVASLDRRGHRGRIVAFSRRGRVSRSHATHPHAAFGDFAEPPPATALELLVRLRRALRAAAVEDRPWQAVFDAARRDGQAVWLGLPEAQRRALLRHLRPYWDVHRYRIAPQVGAVLRRRRAEGTLETLAASLGAIERRGRTLRCQLLPRGARPSDEPRWAEAEAFVVTTGPAHADAIARDPALRGLARQGHLRPDGLGLGLLVDRRHRAIGVAGAAAPTLLVAGPLARGTFGELMGLPQVARAAEAVADLVREQVAASAAWATGRAPAIATAG